MSGPRRVMEIVWQKMLTDQQNRFTFFLFCYVVCYERLFNGNGLKLSV